MPFPDRYPSPQHLPFNRTALAAEFELESPDRDPGGAGVWVLLRSGELLVTDTPQATLPEGVLPAGDAARAVYIGRHLGRPCRALKLSPELALPAGLRSENLLAAQPGLSLALLSLAGTAGSILHWLGNSRHCARCGAATVPMPGEWGRTCSSCGYAHFPHIHPCVIVLVRRGRELLLTRKAGWPPGRYSLVAGFLDFGECLEEAVAREVREETGVTVSNVRYVGSQSWPFPSQLMAGFVADYVAGEVVVETTELEDARWFSIDALPLLPPKRSIARYILDHFGNESPSAS